VDEAERLAEGGAVERFVVDGPPGTGKTTTILRSLEPGVPVATYTRAAAQEVRQRGGVAGTIYSLTWPHAQHYSKTQGRSGRESVAYQTRPIYNSADPALERYEAEAPSLKPRSDWEGTAMALHDRASRRSTWTDCPRSAPCATSSRWPGGWRMVRPSPRPPTRRPSSTRRRTLAPSSTRACGPVSPGS